MRFFDFPPEIRGVILDHTVHLRGSLARALRMRTVSKQFSAEVDEAILRTRLLGQPGFNAMDSYFRACDVEPPQIWISHYTRAIMLPPEELKAWTAVAVTIRRAVEEFCSYASPSTMPLTIAALEPYIENVVQMRLKYTYAPPLSSTTVDESTISTLVVELAAYLNCHHVIDTLTKPGSSGDWKREKLTTSGRLETTGLFNDALRYAAAQGHIKMTERLLNMADTAAINGLCYRPCLGSVAIFDMIVDRTTGDPADPRFKAFLIALLESAPDPPFYKRVWERISRPARATYNSSWWKARRLACYSGRGNLSMVRFLLDEEWDDKVPRELMQDAMMWASRRGYSSIVELLLQRGARVQGPMFSKFQVLNLLPVAVGGNISVEVVRVLLNHGANDLAGPMLPASSVPIHKAAPDAAQMGPRPLLKAVRNENEAMVRLLWDYSSTGYEKAMKEASNLKLNSMVKLLAQLHRETKGPNMAVIRETSSDIWRGPLNSPMAKLEC